MIDTIAPDVLQSVSRNANVSDAAVIALGNLRHLVRDDLQHVAGRDAPEHADALVDEVGDREEAGDRDERQDRGKEREEEVVRLLSRQVEEVVGDDTL